MFQGPIEAFGLIDKLLRGFTVCISSNDPCIYWLTSTLSGLWTKHSHHLVKSSPVVAQSIMTDLHKCQTPSKRQTNGRADGQTVRPSVRLLDGVWNERTDGRTDAANTIRGVCPSVRLSRVAATSTRRDSGDRWTLLPCVFVRPSVRLLDGVWH